MSRISAGNASTPATGAPPGAGETDNADVLAVAIPQLQSDEGLRLEAYPDPLSELGKRLDDNAERAREGLPALPADGLDGAPWTVGYGCTGEDIGPDTVWTEAQAVMALQARCEGICNQFDTSIPWWRDLGPIRAAVLINMAYQMGVQGLLGFPLTLAAMQDWQFHLAAGRMLMSAWSHQTPERAQRLAAQVSTGAVQ